MKKIIKPHCKSKRLEEGMAIIMVERKNNFNKIIGRDNKRDNSNI
jgi:hypothetical protein